MNLTDEQKRMLTEYLGECWHEMEPRDMETPACIHCRKKEPWCHWHSFSDRNDLGDLYDRMAERGELGNFLADARYIWLATGAQDYWTLWLFAPDRIETVAEWLKEKQTD